MKGKGFILRLFGKAFADSERISREQFEALFVDGIHLVTKDKKNMKNPLVSLYGKIQFWKRILAETVNDEFKNVCDMSIQDTARLTVSLQI